MNNCSYFSWFGNQTILEQIDNHIVQDELAILMPLFMLFLKLDYYSKVDLH